MVSGRMETAWRATTATSPLVWEKKMGRLPQQPPPRTPSPAKGTRLGVGKEGELTVTIENDQLVTIVYYGNGDNNVA